MRYEEEQLSAAVEELKRMAAKAIDQRALAALGIIIDGFETMRPYVRVGLGVCPSDETLDAINLLHHDRLLTHKQWHTLTKVLRLARARNIPPRKLQALRKPCRSVTPRHFGRSSALTASGRNRRF